MKEFITIKNFGPLHDINKLELLPMTILIGDSSSGKSTLMKIVSAMRYIYQMANIRSYLKLSKITNSPFNIRFASIMQEYGLSGMIQDDTEIVYKVVNPITEGNSYEIIFKGNKLSRLPVIEKENLLLSKISFISDHRNIIPIWIDKAPINEGATLDFCFHEMLKDFLESANDDQVVNLDSMGIKMHISHPKGKNVQLKVESLGKNGHDKIDLKDCSSGIQTAVPVLLITKYLSDRFSFKDSFNRSVLEYLHETDMLTKFKAVTEPANLKKVIYVHVEEPELSISPDNQCKLIDEIVSYANHSNNDRNVQLMMSTQSQHIKEHIIDLMINQTNENQAHVDSSNIAVYKLFNGTYTSLMIFKDSGKYLIV